MISSTRILQIKQDIFKDASVSDESAALEGVREDLTSSLRPDIFKEITTYKRGLIISSIADAIADDDRAELLKLTNWSHVNYDLSRATNRYGLVSASMNSWDNRTYLDASTFKFDQNSKNIDKFITALILQRILAFNIQEKKRISEIFRQGKSLLWSPNQIADQIKLTAGLNSVQQRTLFNIQKGLRAEGISAGVIAKRTDAYIAKAITYRTVLTSEWEASSSVNEGQLQLWNQLYEEDLLRDETRKEWLAILDNLTGTADRAMSGQIVPLNANFVDPTLTYAPLPRPPLRGNCRCTIQLIY